MIRRSIALMLALAVLAVACGDDEEAARTTVTVMTHDSFAVSDDVLEAFEAEHDLDVEVLFAGDAGSLVNQAVLTEGDPLADLLYGVDNTFLGRALDAEIFEPYESPGLSDVGVEFRLDPEHRVTPIDYGDVCLNYDEEFFSGQLSPPESLADLVDPAYAELTVVEDPALSSPGLAFLLATIAEYGDGWTDYWTALADNGVLVAPDWESAWFTSFSVTGGGDRPIVVSYASSPPVTVLFAEDPTEAPGIGVVESGCFRQVELAGVLAGAENPEGARELLDFMLSEQFQADMPLNMFVFPVREDVALPDVFVEHAVVPAAPLQLDPAAIAEGRDDWIEQWTELVVG